MLSDNTLGRRLIALIKSILTYIGGPLLAITVVFGLVLPTFVQGTSMIPTIYPGDMIVADRVFEEVNRFDIVIVRNKYNNNKLIIKRVIGLPGDFIRFKDNELYINDELVEQDFDTIGNTLNFSIQLGEDEYFIMGDNRERSRDSRFFGPYALEDIVAIKIDLSLIDD